MSDLIATICIRVRNGGNERILGRYEDTVKQNTEVLTRDMSLRYNSNLKELQLLLIQNDVETRLLTVHEFDLQDVLSSDMYAFPPCFEVDLH